MILATRSGAQETSMKRLGDRMGTPDRAESGFR